MLKSLCQAVAAGAPGGFEEVHPFLVAGPAFGQGQGGVAFSYNQFLYVITRRVLVLRDAPGPARGERRGSSETTYRQFLVGDPARRSRRVRVRAVPGPAGPG